MSDERGVTTAYFGVFLLALAVVVGGFTVVLSYAATAHQAATAADLSALAGAQAGVEGRDACAAARVIARANRAELARCDRIGQAVVVETTVGVQLRAPGLPGAATARATAAPQEDEPR